ncbi:hypothetical protein PISL3812_01979 [Talaromyces islandicus]|uniref:Helicase C-terminal domain-containing protein n=1 Tax=Talaromyces islandicus TaxID=28573 RepID=A0A0U1LNP4_TALIS|nr:hypothetical protein PISL3812_01979 [Talaromyces islandicus]
MAPSNVLSKLAEEIKKATRNDFPLSTISNLDDEILGEIPRGPYLLSSLKATDMVEEEEIHDGEPEHKPGFVNCGGTLHATRNYVGAEWEEKYINGLENAPACEIPEEKFDMQPHPWQSRGAFQLQLSVYFPLSWGYLRRCHGAGQDPAGDTGDGTRRQGTGLFFSRGMPSRLQAAVGERDICCLQKGKTTPVLYVLVTCRLNIEAQEYQPKVLILEDTRLDAHTLSAAKWDIVIVSYHFLANIHRSIEKFGPRLENFCLGSGAPPTRPTGSLLSTFWSLVDLPVKRLILDECHVVKKKDGSFFKAARAVPRRATVMFSGTVLNNRWCDVGNLVTWLQGHHLTTHQHFLHAFCQPQHQKASEYADPDFTALQRFLLAVLIARPSDSLTLPGLVTKDVVFELNETEKVQVLDATMKFERAKGILINQAKNHSNNEASNAIEALSLAIQAQIAAAHLVLADFSARKAQPLDSPAMEIEGDPEEIVVQLLDMQGQESTAVSADWRKYLRDIPSSDLRGRSSRIQALVKLVKYILRTWPGEKIVLFSTYLRFLDIVDCVLTEENNVAFRYDGSMNKDKRSIIQERFDGHFGSAILLITSGSGGVGLNLQSASIVVQSEVWWNTNTERQAYARCYRQGQQKEVKVFRLMASNSAIDDTMRASQKRKMTTNKGIMAGLIRKVSDPLTVPT